MCTQCRLGKELKIDPEVMVVTFANPDFLQQR
jgi:hypothetical protein